MTTHTTPNQIKLNVNAGNLPAWASQQAERLGKLRSFQPGGYNCVGYSRAVRSLKRQLRDAGLAGSFLDNAIHDIVDLARLNAIAA